MSLVRFIAAGTLLAIGSVCARGEESPLADAAEKKDGAVVRALLERKVNVNSPQADGMTALHWATYHDDFELVKLLLAGGADAKATNRYGVSSLSLACTNGNSLIVEVLLESGVDANFELPGGEDVSEV